MNKNEEEQGAWQAREFLRKTLVGKIVSFRSTYKVPSGREYGVIFLPDGRNVTELLLKEGLVKLREESSKREDVDGELMNVYQAAQSQAVSESKGLWSSEQSKISVQFDQPFDVKSFLSKFVGKSLEAVVEHVRTGDIVRARVITSESAHQYLNLLVAGVKAPQSSRLSDGVVVEGEPYGEAAKEFVETRLIQRSVQVTLLGTNQSETAFIAQISHPAGNIAEALLSAGLARVVDWQSTMIGTEGMSKLRQAEARGKAAGQNIFKGRVAKASTSAGSYDAVVSRIVSGDSIMVRTKDGKEKRVQFSSIRQPKAGTPQAAYLPDIKEFLRKKLIGKHVDVAVDYHKPAADGFDERDCATVTAAKMNIAKALVERGYTSVIRHRRDDEDRSPIYDELLAVEETAVSEQKGIHSNKTPAQPARVVEASENEKRAKQYLSTLQRVKRVPAVVEYVASGGRFKVSVPRENARLTFILSGIKVPRTARNKDEQSEPLGDEAHDFASRKTFQRDVEIEVETVDRVGGFVGTLYINRENFAVQLLSEGLASIHEHSAEQSGHGLLYREAENRAKQDKKGMWHNYSAQAEEEKLSASTNAIGTTGAQSVNGKTTKEFIDCVVSDVGSDGSFFIQQIGPSVKQLESLMSELQIAYKSPQALTSKPKVGDQIACKFTEDGAWYRARVRRVDHATNKAEVYYYDYGNSEMTKFSNLSPLTAKYSSLPAQAKEARLSFVNLPESTNEYFEDSVAFFQSIVQKELVASVDARNGNTLFLSLFDPQVGSTTRDSINAEMVEAGWASVMSAKQMTWEKAYGTTIKILQDLQREASRKRYGIFEYGDNTPLDD